MGLSDAQPLNAQAERLAAAKRVQEQRENGIRAQAIKQGRELERQDLQRAAGVATLEEISLLAQVRQEHAQELQRVETQWQREERKHGRHQRWLGLSFGIPIGMVFACIAIFLMQGVIWQTATDAFREQAMTGALLSGGAER